MADTVYGIMLAVQLALALAVVQVAPLAGDFTSVTVLLFIEKSRDQQSLSHFQWPGIFIVHPLQLCAESQGGDIEG